jgi:hypothetical protein
MFFGVRCQNFGRDQLQGVTMPADLSRAAFDLQAAGRQ